MDSVLEVLNCGLSSGNDAHVCENPIPLTCGHSICQNCLLPNVNLKEIKCNTCGKINERDLNQKQDPIMFKILLNQSMDKLFETIMEKLKSTFQNCVNKVEAVDQLLEISIETIRDQIEIRVHSLKIELDNLHKTFNHKLDEIKLEMKETTKSDAKFDLEFYLKQLNDLEDKIKNKESLNKETFYCYQNKLKDLRQIVQKLDDVKPNISFNCGVNTMESNMIGEIIYNER